MLGLFAPIGVEGVSSGRVGLGASSDGPSFVCKRQGEGKGGEGKGGEERVRRTGGKLDSTLEQALARGWGLL